MKCQHLQQGAFYISSMIWYMQQQKGKDLSQPAVWSCIHKTPKFHSLPYHSNSQNEFGKKSVAYVTQPKEKRKSTDPTRNSV